MHRYVHASGERHPAMTALQALTSKVQRGERRRAHRIDGHARPLQIEKIRYPVGDSAGAAAGRAEVSLLSLLYAKELVFFIHHAGKYTDLVFECLKPGPRIASVFQRFPGGLQEETLLRIHAFGLERRDIEEQRIELIDVVDKAAPFTVAFAELSFLRLVEAIQLPAIGGYFGDAVDARPEVFPKNFQVVRAGIAAAEAYDGDGLVLYRWSSARIFGGKALALAGNSHHGCSRRHGRNGTRRNTGELLKLCCMIAEKIIDQ